MAPVKVGTARFELTTRCSQSTARLRLSSHKDLQIRPFRRDKGDIARQGRLTLVYAARDPEYNDAVVLAGVIRHGRRT